MYTRHIQTSLAKWLDRPEIIVLTGSRQTGKTYFVREILPNSTTLDIEYFNFEDLELRDLFNRDAKTFLLNTFQKGKLYVFDEFQKAPNLTSALKVLYDESKLNFPKVILTGSSSLMIQEKISQSLAGQGITFNLYSLSFMERHLTESFDFLKDASQLNIKELEKRVFIRQNELKRMFHQYLLEGGYPELGELSLDLRWEKLKSIIQTILEKDLQSLVKPDHLFSSKKLLEILAHRIGHMISFESLASELQLNIKTVRKLIAILEGLFFIELIYPHAHYGNEYKKAPKVYFYDLGIRNELIKIRVLPSDSQQMGHIVENFIFGQIKRYCAYNRDFKINYWQNYNKNEVDFILCRDNEITSIEVKYRKGQKMRLTSGITHFIEKYHPKAHITVTHDYFGQSEFKGCQIYFIPAYVFGLII
jgi:uncharacterized protein